MSYLKGATITDFFSFIQELAEIATFMELPSKSDALLDKPCLEGKTNKQKTRQPCNSFKGRDWNDVSLT